MRKQSFLQRLFRRRKTVLFVRKQRHDNEHTVTVEVSKLPRHSKVRRRYHGLSSFDMVTISYREASAQKADAFLKW